MYLECLKNVRIGDVIHLEDGSQYLSISPYIDQAHPLYAYYGPGYISVLNMKNYVGTTIVMADLKRITKIVKTELGIL